MAEDDFGDFQGINIEVSVYSLQAQIKNFL